LRLAQPVGAIFDHGGAAINTFVAAVLAFLLATSLVWLLSRSFVARQALDKPNERSLHSVPVPRTGGLGLLGAVATIWLFLAPSGWIWLLLVTALLSLLSFGDDLAGLPVRTRLAGQTAASAVFLALYFNGPLVLLPLALLTLIWLANLYNFMDGSDGLAGGMTITGFGAYAIAAWSAGAVDLSVICAAVAGAAAGFLIWNFHKAIVFMGDAGSVAIGFLAAAVGMLGWQENAWPIWFPFLIFSPFIVDATVTLAKRVRRGERLSEPHKSHYYQRILQMGLGHRGTALASYALMASVSASALHLRNAEPLHAGLLIGLWIAAYASIMWHIDRRWARHAGDAAKP
jgi:UDP-N-acetylmuramyl pentapeptide phosphotransferase/UDP-N-acetylglucosamine-1-phosphate transferase